MKLRSSIIIFLALSAIILTAYYPKGDGKEREVVIFSTLLDILDEVHFNPKAIDDDFSKEAFDLFLDYVDHGKRYLTQEDIAALKPFELEIDDQAKVRSLDFFNETMVKLDAGFDKAKQYYDEIIAGDLATDVEGNIQLDGEKKERAANDAELKEYWRQSLTYDYISDIYEIMEDQEELEDDEEVLTTEEIESKAKEKVEERWDKWFERMKKIRRSDRFETYLNTFTHLFDPHSDYYNPKEKQDFDIVMGGKLEGIGARLTLDGDYIKVMEIIPGGPAWKGKELEVDDKIMEVRQDGEEGVNVVGWRTDDAVQLIRGKQGTVVHLKVKKKDNSTEDIRIEREEVIIDESFARSVIMDIPNKINNVGYIKLPKFYSSFERKGGNSCAEDIKIELDKLTEQNVDGIILDLRYNGGGSLNDVVKMSGLFIENGPIVQVKPRKRKPYVYEDKDASVSWDGPLIVMVNSYSASASEILVAALQDYKRAVIVGSNSTFGKGTVQRFFDLDRAISGNSTHKPLGQIKLTMQKFYRVNGQSTQLKGVVPDIILPDRFSYIDVGEREYDHAMEWSTIEPVSYAQNVYDVRGIESLKDKSEARINSSDDFNLIKENALRIKEDRDMSEFPVGLDNFATFMGKRELEAEKFKGLMKDSLDQLQIANLLIDMDYINLDESRVARNEDWIKGLYKDIYIEETLYIMKDMLDMDQQP